MFTFRFQVLSHFRNHMLSLFRNRVFSLSGFCTKPEQISLWGNQIRNCFRFLRNKGKLVVVGGKGSKYQEIYTSLDSTLLDYNFSNNLNIGKCNKLSINQSHLQFDLSDHYGERLKQYYRFVFQLFKKNDSVKYMSPEVKEHFNNYTGEKTGRPKKWEMHIYDKYARLKWYKLRK